MTLAPASRQTQRHLTCRRPVFCAATPRPSRSASLGQSTAMAASQRARSCFVRRRARNRTAKTRTRHWCLAALMWLPVALNGALLAAFCVASLTRGQAFLARRTRTVGSAGTIIGIARVSRAPVLGSAPMKTAQITSCPLATWTLGPAAWAGSFQCLASGAVGRQPVRARRRPSGKLVRIREAQREAPVSTCPPMCTRNPCTLHMCVCTRDATCTHAHGQCSAFSWWWRAALL